MARLERAPSGRARCRRCEAVIERGTVRVAIRVATSDYDTEVFQHVDCFVEDNPNEALGAFLGASVELQSAARALVTDRDFLATLERSRAAASPDAPPVELGARTTELLAALERSPRDRQVLSVLADHLQELGDARGELMSLELSSGAPARVIELKRQLWTPIEHVRVTWGPGFLRTMAITLPEGASPTGALRALEHPSARLLEEITFRGWHGPLPPLPASARRLELESCVGVCPSLEQAPSVRHLRLSGCDDADAVSHAGLESIDLGERLTSTPRAASVPRLSCVVSSAVGAGDELIEAFDEAGLLAAARVLVLSYATSRDLIGALSDGRQTFDQLVLPRLHASEAEREALAPRARQVAVSFEREPVRWYVHSTRPEWGVGELAGQSATSLELVFASGPRSFSKVNAPVYAVDVV